jgi:ABC-type multidrug transport system ATPase subunit
LLEVGTGFHQELTGRENTYLNGSILGMTRHDIHSKFDEIVEFSGVRKFIDTPVKHYSSGMRVRLAFAVAAHLQPNILFVDEVLAVGDLEFQQKCLTKMKSIVSEGRTVLLVSHNLAAINELCKTCVVLDGGELQFNGPVDEALARYCLSMTEDPEKGSLMDGWYDIHVLGTSTAVSSVETAQPFVIEGRLELAEEWRDGIVVFKIKDAAGNTLIREKTGTTETFSRSLNAGRYQISIQIPNLWLAPGMYVMRFWFTGHTKHGEEKSIYSTQVILNITGSFQEIDHYKVMLHPDVQWNLAYKTGPVIQSKV